MKCAFASSKVLLSGHIEPQFFGHVEGAVLDVLDEVVDFGPFIEHWRVTRAVFKQVMDLLKQCHVHSHELVE